DAAGRCGGDEIVVIPGARAMRIAQIAPLAESCPPRLYGGTERIVSFLTEELVAQGHEVTLFASGDTRTAATLVPCSRQAPRLDSDVKDHLPTMSPCWKKFAAAPTSSTCCTPGRRR